jgi:nitroimidazol reductase NimA-like FMN-containing flavoprotein (pyridoxamine 5'-phosphate oxidase superfamily)
VHETPTDLADLQRLLDASHAAAGAHMASIFSADRRASASEVTQLLRGVCVLALATVSTDGAPFVAPVDGLFFRGHFTFCSSPDSLRFRYIRRDPRVSASYNRGEDFCVIVHGRAREIDPREPWSLALREYNREVYGESWDTCGYWGRAPYAAIEPRRMFAALMNRAILGA